MHILLMDGIINDEIYTAHGIDVNDDDYCYYRIIKENKKARRLHLSIERKSEQLFSLNH